MENESDLGTDTQEDNTSDDSQDDSKNDSGEDSSDVKTLTAQKNKWKEKAVDPDTGKTYKELLAESKKKPKSKTETSKNEEQPNKPDYALDAFLEGRGVKNPDDIKVVKDEMKLLKREAGEVLGMEHIKSKLKEAKTQREAEDSMPEGGGGTSGSNKTSVDYCFDDCPGRQTATGRSGGAPAAVG